MKLNVIRQTKSPNKLDLVFDNDTKVRVMATVVPDLGLYGGMTVDDAHLEEILEASRAASAKARAVRIVSASAVTRKELHRRLTQKGETPDDAAAAVAWLEELGAVDDGETATRIVRKALAKGYGAARIRQELYAKGVPKQYWDAAMEHLPEMDDAIDRFLEQRLRGQWPDDKLLRKTTDALMRRGHNWSDIRAALNRYKQGLEQLEE
ncbi:MAG: regulatory protein RecX [Oscillospiraceae bacterium]|nr:regulatory protein RecX [Oscillospiraceae bacterium]